ncbi:stage II sporulation protein M [Knoellia locipacati]|uniref:Membrane protein n=1 Tax=Knoellia locipacati TaxID=882824 RepID=A0A512SWP7_9MICO|nr:stage II sporulation protein M [Knoellia locipacati]GEQ12376.1 membrane protein [Knoellia locipacati]
MDLDAFIATHLGQWRRLEELVGRRRLSGAESDELLDLYQRVSTHLSVVRSSSPDPSLVSYLSALLARARHTATGSRATTWRDGARFFTQTFPAALYRTRRWWLATMVGSVLLALVVGAWAVRHPEVFTQQMTRGEIDAYVGTDFENYYSEYPHHEFATLVWTNNAWVAAQCIAMGVLGLPVLWVLAQNVISVGLAGALMVSHDRGSLFFGLILPHGLLELTAIFVAAAVGLRLFWSWIEPGPRSRLDSLAAEGRTAAGIALGLVVVLFVSGGIEGFVTPSGLPTWGRILIGIVAESLFFAYVFVVGRRAARAGVTGDVAESDQVATAPVAA